MSFVSPFAEVEIPSTSLYDYLFGDIDDAHLDRIALVDAKSGRQTTYRDMIGRIDAFAGALADRCVNLHGCTLSSPTAQRSEHLVGDRCDAQRCGNGSAHANIGYDGAGLQQYAAGPNGRWKPKTSTARPSLGARAMVF